MTNEEILRTIKTTKQLILTRKIVEMLGSHNEERGSGEFNTDIAYKI